MTTDKLKLDTQTQVTILAALDSSKVQLFLVNKGVALEASDRVKDMFTGETDALSVTVTVVSTSGEVVVSNSSDSSGSWSWTTSKVPVGGITVYSSSATCDMLSTVDKVTDKFTIKVGGIPADPTVVISRGGTANNLVIGSGPKQG